MDDYFGDVFVKEDLYLIGAQGIDNFVKSYLGTYFGDHLVVILIIGDKANYYLDQVR